MKTIEQFIDDFITSQNTYIEHGEEALRHTFRAGYCYYFAKMLEVAYPGGEVCNCFPYGHMVYSYKGKYYDIEGEYKQDCDYLIPERFLGDAVKDFMHNGSDNGTTKEELTGILQSYLESTTN